MRAHETWHLPLIESVGELRSLLVGLSDDTPIRFSDPDTGWEMRFRSALCESEYSTDWVVIATEDYAEMRDTQ